jgi:diacylglycerol kinase family enzyme
MGLSPMIGEGIPHNLKRWLGRVGYLIWAFWCLIRFHAFRLTVRGEGIDETLWATEVRIANGGHHGGVELIESAELDSGQIVVQAVVGRRASSLLWDWWAKYWKLPTRNRTTREFHGRRLVIETRPRQRISIDGEVLARTPCVATVAEYAIEVVVPAAAAPAEKATETAAETGHASAAA